MYSQEIEVKGHLIDSMILSRIFDAIMDMKGEFEVLEFSIGKRKYEQSHVRLMVKADSRERLDQILDVLYRVGASPAGAGEAKVEGAPDDGVPPSGFYVTTNHPTQVNVGGRWLDVEGIAAYRAIVYDGSGSAVCRPPWSLRRGELVVVGEDGVRVNPPERPREGIGIFEFMSAPVPRPATPSLISGLAEEIVDARERGGRVLIASGSAAVRTGAADSLASILHKGYVDVLVASNNLLLYDVEYRLYGTAMGAPLRPGSRAGYGNHVRAAAEVRAAGGISALIEGGRLREGIAFEAEAHGLRALSIAGPDDEPMPGVISDAKEAQLEVSRALEGVELAVVVSGGAVADAVLGAMPSTVKLVVVDLNPSAALRALGREAARSLGVVSDVASFLPALDHELRELPGRSHNP